MIKRIHFVYPNGCNVYTRLYRLQFVERKEDGDWGIYEVGKSLSNSGYRCTFEYLSCNHVDSSPYMTPAFLFNGGFGETYQFGPTNVDSPTYRIEFTNPIAELKGFYYYWDIPPTEMYVFDENDNIIFEEKNLGLAKCTGDALSSNYFYDTPTLRINKAYKTNIVGTVETNNVSHITNVHSINQIKPNQIEHEKTSIRYLLSFDNRNTYKAYNTDTSNWEVIDKSEIMTKGMTNTTLEGLTASEYTLVLTDNKTIDVMFGMVTSDANVSPSISKIEINYLEIV